MKRFFHFSHKTARNMSRQAVLNLYLAGVVWAAVVMVLGLVLLGYSVEAPWVVVLLAAVAAVAERATVRLSSNLEESISLLPTLFAAVQFGPLEAMIVAAGSMLWDLRPAQDHEAPYKKWAVYTSSRSLIAAVTGLVAGVLYSVRRRWSGKYRHGNIRRRNCRAVA